jgi:hypothetical protein
MGKGRRSSYASRGGSGGGPYTFPLDSRLLSSRVSFQAIQIRPGSGKIAFRNTNTSKDITSSGGGGNALDAVNKSISGDPAISDPASLAEENIITKGYNIAVDTGSNIANKTMEVFGQAKSGELAQTTGMKARSISGDKCDIYLPIAFAVTEGLNYEQASLNLAGAAVAGSINSGLGLGAGMQKAIEGGFESLVNIFDAVVGGAASGDAARIAAIRGVDAPIVGALTPEAVKAGVSVGVRASMNPNIRAKFSGVNIREFTFSFDFIPKSQRESLMVKKIIRYFRFHAYPEEIPSGRAFSIAFNYPNMFKIRLLTNRGGTFRNIGTPLKLCYLRNINTVYNPTSQALHPDGAPNQVSLTLTFMEYKPLSRHDIVNEGQVGSDFEGVGIDAMDQSLMDAINAGNDQIEQAAREEAESLGLGV